MQAPVFGGEYFLVDIAPANGVAVEPPLLLIHGLGTAGLMDFEPWLSSISSSRRVLAVDLPGFARSSNSEELYEPAAYAEFLAHVVLRHAGGEADVLGHSLGGAMAIALSGRYPSLVRRMVLVDAAGLLHREVMLQEMRRGGAEPGAVSGKLSDTVDRFYAGALGVSGKVMPDVDRLLQHAGIRRGVLGEEALKTAALTLLQHDFESELRAVRAPTLLLWGAADSVAPRRNYELLSGLLPVRRRVLLSGVGHNPMREGPPGVAPQISQFLALKELPPALSLKLKDDSANGAQPEGTAPPGPSIRAAGADGTAICRGEMGIVFSGYYRSIELFHCRDALLQHATVDHLRVVHSTVNMTHVHVRAGAELAHSRLRATAVDFEGSPALSLDRSVSDLAGVLLKSQGVALKVHGKSQLMASVTRIDAPHGKRSLHGPSGLPAQTRIE